MDFWGPGEGEQFGVSIERGKMENLKKKVDEIETRLRVLERLFAKILKPAFEDATMKKE